MARKVKRELTEVDAEAEVKRRSSRARRALFENRDVFSSTPENEKRWRRESEAASAEELLAVREEYCRKYGCWDRYQHLLLHGPRVEPR
jgi:hypothetical protein